MRTIGGLGTADRLGAHGHVCWAFRGHDEFLRIALPFLEEGFAAGERVLLVGTGDVDALVDAVAASAVLAPHVGDGSVEVQSVTATYGRDEIVVPPDQVTAYAQLTAGAVADGFTGLRVAANATDLVRTAAQRDAFITYEHLVDRFMVGAPFTAMCAYDLDELGADVVAELACMHPAAVDGLTTFHVHAVGDAHAAIAGEVDGLCARRLTGALRRLPGDDADALVFDASNLTFVDHHGLRVLDEYGARHDRAIVLRRAPRVAARQVELLRFRRLVLQDVR